MAEPFKKQLVRFYGPDGQRCEKTTPGAVRQVVESRKYYAFVPQPNGQRRQVPLCPDLASSKKLLNKLLADSTLRQHGIEVTALHSHMIDDAPHLFFMHFWANDDARRLAQGLRAALDLANLKRGS